MHKAFSLWLKEMNKKNIFHLDMNGGAVMRDPESERLLLIDWDLTTDMALYSHDMILTRRGKKTGQVYLKELGVAPFVSKSSLF